MELTWNQTEVDENLVGFEFTRIVKKGAIKSKKRFQIVNDKTLQKD